MLYRSNKKIGNIATFIKESLIDYFGEDKVNITSFNENGFSSDSKIIFEIEFCGEKIKVSYAVKGYLRIYIDEYRINMLNQNVEHEISMYFSDKNFIIGLNDLSGEGISNSYTVFTDTDKGVLIFTLDSHISNKLRPDSPETPILIKDGEITGLKMFRPISVFSRYKDEEGKYFANRLNFISQNKGIIKTELVCIHGELLKDMNNSGYLIEDGCYCNSDMVKYPFAIMADNLGGEVDEQ